MCWDEGWKGPPRALTQRVRRALGSALYTLIEFYLDLPAIHAYFQLFMEEFMIVSKGLIQVTERTTTSCLEMVPSVKPEPIARSRGSSRLSRMRSFPSVGKVLPDTSLRGVTTQCHLTR